MRSHLLEGKVGHRRARPFTYALEHDVWYAALDLDEIDEVDARLRLFGRNRRGVVTFHDTDHLVDPSHDLPGAIPGVPALVPVLTSADAAIAPDRNCTSVPAHLGAATS